ADRAVGLPETAHLEQRTAHTRGLSAVAVVRARSRSGIPSSPPGNHRMRRTTAPPNATRYQPCAKRSHSGTRTPITAPSTGPKNVPEPPTTTIRYIVNDAPT